MVYCQSAAAVFLPMQGWEAHAAMHSVGLWKRAVIRMASTPLAARATTCWERLQRQAALLTQSLAPSMVRT